LYAAVYVRQPFKTQAIDPFDNFSQILVLDRISWIEGGNGSISLAAKLHKNLGTNPTKGDRQSAHHLATMRVYYICWDLSRHFEYCGHSNPFLGTTEYRFSIIQINQSPVPKANTFRDAKVFFYRFFL
jgi:hypothetical protein